MKYLLYAAAGCLLVAGAAIGREIGCLLFIAAFGIVAWGNMVK